MPAEEPLKHFYRPDEIACIFGVSTGTVRRWIRGGKLKAIRIGGVRRIPKAEYCRLAGIDGGNNGH